MKNTETSTDQINISNAKVNLKKGKKELVTKERNEGKSRKEIYIGLPESTEDQKKFRQRIRSKTRRFVNDILGKDRSDAERETSIQDFLKFYKANWKVQDFRIENFSGSKKESDLKDYAALLQYVASTLEGAPKKEKAIKAKKEPKAEVVAE